MRVLYENNVITEIDVNIATLQIRMTPQERIDVWGLTSDQEMGIATNYLENNNNGNLGTPVTLESLVDLMVSKGKITTQRANELKA